jgi:hypothetical protein
MISHKTIRVSWLMAGAFLFSTSAFADDGKVEVAGFGGGTTIADGVGTHAMVGGSAGIRVVEHLHIFGEFSLVPLASASLSDSSAGVTAHGTDRLYNFGGGMDYGFGSSKRVVPYVVAAVGVGHESASATAAASGTSVTVSMTSNSVYLGFGGGVRLYAGNHWGVKPEFRYQRYTNSGGSSNSAVFTVGLFYQFGN